MVMTSSSFVERLKSGPLLFDGGMGTMLHSRGVQLDRCFDALNLTNPALVVDVHRAYVEAGAQVIETNTFGANRFKLSEHGLEHKVAEINRAGVELARRAIEEAGLANLPPARAGVWVAGSVGPTGRHLAPLGRVQPEAAYAAFHEQVVALAGSGVDLIILETFSDLDEMGVAVRAARDACTLPLIAQMTFTEDLRTPLGHSPEQVVEFLANLDLEVVGVNCSLGPALVLQVIQRMRQSLTPENGVALSAQPNAGWPTRTGERLMYPAAPDYFGEYALALIEAGATVVGGCCGTTPDHVRAMRDALDGPRRAPLRISPRPVSEPELTPGVEAPTQLAQKLARGEFVIGVEIDPPKGYAAEKLLAAARMLQEAGADVMNVADSPMARMRMSAWAVCHLIQSRVGMETVLHFPTRGRNLLRVQGDLLAAHALGVRNLFVVMGDPTSIGDYPEAMDEYDLVPSGLIRLIKQGFNRGVDHAGSSIGQPTNFLVGCALNLAAPDLDREVKVLRKKIEAGADFALSQPVYEADVVRRFKAHYQERHGPLSLPILVGVLPLFGTRHAEFLHNEVPGISIPEPIRQRMQRAGEDGPQEGVRMACELLEELAGLVQGIYLMPAFNRFDLAAEIIEQVRATALTKRPSIASHAGGAELE
ncbi:MAG: bifunctional homocysteine S-methyltransferase/methylenetetrahydrofolate reductase [Anaerolineae bacterium]